MTDGIILYLAATDSQILDCTVTVGVATLPQTNPRHNYRSLLRLMHMDANLPSRGHIHDSYEASRLWPLKGEGIHKLS